MKRAFMLLAALTLLLCGMGQAKAGLDLPTDGGHSVKSVYSPLEVHHGSNATYLHP